MPKRGSLTMRVPSSHGDRSELDSMEQGVATRIEERIDAKLCLLQYAAGRVESCPAGRCPFWESGGAVRAGGCAVENVGLGLQLETNPRLAHWLLRVRTRLEDTGSGRLFEQLLPPGLRE